MNICKSCEQPLVRPGNIYCSNKCQRNYEYMQYIFRWKNGEVEGGRGIQAKNISQYLRRYLEEKYGNVCVVCNWSVVNQATGKVPLEIDHIDGNSENNQEANLRLICPNCHALTPNFRNLNKGHGRQWRRIKYIKQV